MCICLGEIMLCSTEKLVRGTLSIAHACNVRNGFFANAEARPE